MIAVAADEKRVPSTRKPEASVFGFGRGSDPGGNTPRKGCNAIGTFGN
jgi:hypothetical protein